MNLKYFDFYSCSWLDISGQPGASLEYDEASGWVTSGGYKKYVAQITQYSEGVPSVRILENTLGFIPDWQRFDNGIYGFDWDGDFNLTKCINYISQDYSNENITYIVYDDSYDITLKASKGDGYIKDQTIEIRYYN